MAAIGKKDLIALAENQNFLGNDYLESNFKSASYDLRIGTIYKGGKVYSNDNVKLSGNIKIKPSEIVTLLTLEVVNIPKNCIGTVFAINRMSSSGFLILNPGHIDPGFRGPISICAINLSKSDINLFHGQPIFTIILNKLDNPLAEDDLYKNNLFVDGKRGLYENQLYSSKFGKLSNSFFDLVVSHPEGITLFKSLLKEFLKKWYSYIIKVLGFIGLIFMIFKFFDYVITQQIEKSNKPDQNKNYINKDSILNIEKQKKIEELEFKIDSILTSKTPQQQ